jgi:ASC-1-like (ASCH) protein
MSGKKSKSKIAQTVISCEQLDFNWRPSPLAQKIQESEGDEIESSTTGRQPLNLRERRDRLFVPLASGPFDWFSRGQKKWELRKRGRQFTPTHVRIGRRVELRRGYRNKDVLWGTIIDILEADSLEELFSKVPFREVIPTASSVEDAVATAKRILNVRSSETFLAFAIGELQ